MLRVMFESICKLSGLKQVLNSHSKVYQISNNVCYSKKNQLELNMDASATAFHTSMQNRVGSFRIKRIQFLWWTKHTVAVAGVDLPVIFSDTHFLRNVQPCLDTFRKFPKRRRTNVCAPKNVSILHFQPDHCVGFGSFLRKFVQEVWQGPSRTNLEKFILLYHFDRFCHSVYQLW